MPGADPLVLDTATIARLCAWLETAELPPPPFDALPGVQAFDIELLRRQTLRSVQAGDGTYGPALMRLRYWSRARSTPTLSTCARARDWIATRSTACAMTSRGCCWRLECLAASSWR